MIRWKSVLKILIFSFLVFLLVFQPGKARADVGVPPAQPGSSLSPGDFETIESTSIAFL